MLSNRISRKPADQRTDDERRYLRLIHDVPYAEQSQEETDFIESVLYGHSFFQLVGAEVQWLNAHSHPQKGRKPMTVAFEDWGPMEWAINLGISVISKESNESPAFTHSKVAYRMGNNLTNRSYSASNAKYIKSQALALRWCRNGETVIFDSCGQGGSVQHRAGGIYCAFLENPGLPPTPLTVVRNVPPPLVGSIETGRKRTGRDEFARFHEEIPSELLRTVDGNGYGTKEGVVRAKVVKILDSAIRKVWQRYQGVDVDGSTTLTGGKFSPNQLFSLLELSHKEEGGIAWLACYAYATLSKFGKDHCGKLYSPEDYVAALILFSNPIPCDFEVDGKVRRYLEPTELLVDEEFARAFLGSISTSWYHENYNYATSQAAGKIATKNRSRKFGSLVELIKYFAENRKLTTLPGPTDPTTGEATTQELWSAPPIPRHTFPSDRSKNESYSCFGGLDCGYQLPIGKEV